MRNFSENMLGISSFPFKIDGWILTVSKKTFFTFKTPRKRIFSWLVGKKPFSTLRTLNSKWVEETLNTSEHFCLLFFRQKRFSHNFQKKIYLQNFLECYKIKQSSITFAQIFSKFPEKKSKRTIINREKVR